MDEKQNENSKNDIELKNGGEQKESIINKEYTKLSDTIDFQERYNNIINDNNISVKGKIIKLEYLKKLLDFYQQNKTKTNDVLVNSRFQLNNLSEGEIEHKFNSHNKHLTRPVNIENTIKSLDDILNYKEKILTFSRKIDNNEKITRDDYKGVYWFVFAEKGVLFNNNQTIYLTNFFIENAEARKEFLEFSYVSIGNGGNLDLVTGLMGYDLELELENVLSEFKDDLTNEELEKYKKEFKKKMETQDKKDFYHIDRARFLKEFLTQIGKEKNFKGEKLKTFLDKTNKFEQSSCLYEILKDNNLYNLGVDLHSLGMNLPEGKDIGLIVLENKDALLKGIDKKIKELDILNKENPTEKTKKDIEDYKLLKENLEKFIKIKIDEERLKKTTGEDLDKMVTLFEKGKSNEEIMMELEKGNKNLRDFNQKVGLDLNIKEKNSNDFSNINFSSSVINASSYRNGGDFFEEFFRNFDSGKEGETKTVSYNDGFKVNISKDGDRYNIKYGDKVESCDKDEVKNVINMGRYMNKIGLGFLFGGINRVIYRIKEKGDGKINEKDGLSNDEMKLGLKSIGEALIPGFDSTKTQIKDLEEQFTNRDLFNQKINELRVNKRNKLPKKLIENNGNISSLEELAKLMYPGDSKGKDFSIDSFIKNI